MAPVETPPKAPTRPRATDNPFVLNLLSGVLGGLVVLVVGAILIATDVIDTGDTTREVVEQPIAKPGTLGSSPAKGGRPTVNDIYKRDAPGVVFVEARVGRQSSSPFGLPELQQGTATGSGFVVDKEGFVLTNAHVVAEAEGGKVKVRFGETEEYEAEVAGSDPSTDIAVLKVDAPKDRLKPLELGDSSDVNVGDPTVAIGNPFGFDRTVTTGIVSALQRQIEAPNGFSINNVIQTDASINPGNSGGPLIDASGKVIGINSQIATGGARGSVGIGFAVPIDTAKRVIPDLKKGGKVERAYMGVTTAPVDKQIADDLNLPADKGALVQEVVPGGPADKAGIEAGETETAQGVVAGGDLIVKVDGKSISKPQDVAGAIDDNKPGDEVEIEYFRGDQKKTSKVKLGKRPERLGQQPSSGSPQLPQQPEGPEDLLPFP